MYLATIYTREKSCGTITHIERHRHGAGCLRTQGKRGRVLLVSPERGGVSLSHLSDAGDWVCQWIISPLSFFLKSRVLLTPVVTGPPHPLAPRGVLLRPLSLKKVFDGLWLKHSAVTELILLGTSDRSAFSLFGLKPRKARCSSWAHETWVLLFSVSTLRALGGKHRKFLGNRSSFCSDAAQLHHSCCSATAPPPSPHPEPRFPHYPRQQPATHHLLPYLSGAWMLSLLHVSGLCFLQLCSCISLVYQTPSPHMSCSTPVLEWPWEMVKDREAWRAAVQGVTVVDMT